MPGDRQRSAKVMCNAKIVDQAMGQSASSVEERLRRIERDWLSGIELSSATALFDLSHPLGVNTPVYPGDEPFSRSQAGRRDRDGFLDYLVTHNEHIGTHIDAPCHFVEGGDSVDAIAPQELVAPLAILNLREKAARNPDYRAAPDDILDWERDHGRLPKGAIVVLDQGWSARFSDAKAFCGLDESGNSHTPGWGAEAAALLAEEREVLAIGTDTFSLDAAEAADFPVHKLWLGSGRWGIEGLANLEQAPAAGAVVFVGANKLQDGTGASARVLAFA